MPIEMEYDIFTRTDNESASVISEREREGGRAMVVSADWFISWVRWSHLTPQMPHSKAKVSPSSSPWNLPAFVGAGLPQPLPGFLPNVLLVLVFGLLCVQVLLSLRPFLGPAITWPAFLFSKIKIIYVYKKEATISYYFTFFPQEATFEIRPSFSFSLSFPFFSCNHLRACKLVKTNHTANEENAQCTHQTCSYFSMLLKKWQQNGFKGRFQESVPA